MAWGHDKGFLHCTEQLKPWLHTFTLVYLRRQVDQSLSTRNHDQGWVATICFPDFFCSSILPSVCPRTAHFFMKQHRLHVYFKIPKKPLKLNLRQKVKKIVPRQIWNESRIFLKKKGKCHFDMNGSLYESFRNLI